VRGWLWPEKGWARTLVYTLKRLGRLPGTPHSIAAGFACGAAISFTPFIGFHIALAVLLCLLVRGNFVAAAVGTLVGNPWTFPFIWILTFELGQILLGAEAVHGVPPPSERWGIERMLDNLGRLMWPMTVGGIPSALVAWFVFYVPMLRAITAYQTARRNRRERARRRRPGIEPSSP